jgi:probable FeS assembly SUF system protein SufT
MSNPTTLPRDLEAVQIPSGDAITLKAGSPFSVTQALGASITLLYANAYMVRIDRKDADAVGVTLEEILPVAPAGPIEEKTVYDQLRKVFDPEIPVNIVDLGLVYDCQIGQMAGGAHRVDVKMTLTAPGCGMGPVIAEDAKKNVLAIPGVEEAHIELVWDPPWNQSMMSEIGKMQLGLI